MQRSTRRQVLGTAVGSGVVLAAAMALSPATVLRNAEALSTRPVLFVAILGLVYFVRPFVLWPISAVSVVVGYVYGLAVGVPVALAGAVFTSLPPFFLARSARERGGLFGSLGETGDRLVEVTGALRGIVAARLAPMPADAVAYAAGLSRVPVRSMLLGTVLGEFPWVVAAVLAGSSMRSLTVAGLDAGFPLVVAAASLSVLVLAGPAYRHFRTRRGPA